MASSIDATQPEQGNPTTLSVRDNFAAAKGEIETLQGQAAALEAGTSTAYSTTTTNGVVELATLAEVDTGTDTTRVITPSTLASSQLAADVASALAGTGDLNGRTLTAGAGLTGGGTLAADRTFNVGAGTGITVAADSIAFDTTWGDGRYLQSYTETDTLASVTARGATTSTACTFNGDVNFRANVDLADNDVLRFGTSDDVEIFHNGTHTYIDLNNTGDLYIRDTTTTRFLFDKSTGDFHADGDVFAASTSVGSDERLKQNVEDVNGALAIVERMRGVEFEWRRDNTKSSGVIAQEIMKILPHVVVETNKLSEEGEFLTVNYNALSAYLIEAIKELAQENQDLRKTIAVQYDGMRRLREEWEQFVKGNEEEASE